ncbi:MAG: undecaprenyl-phosphate glucose phosphotransferase [Calditrichia bacterium]|nr:undecaprenyl-phosphate glucose phosphotransferase [Calditrichia bacterium]
MHKGIYKKNLLVPFLKIVVDIISIEAAIILSYVIRFHSPFTDFIPVPKGIIPPFTTYLYFSFLIILIFIFLFSIANSYRSRFFTTFSEDIPVVLKTCLTAILLSMSVAFLYRDFSYSRLVFILIFFNTNIILLIERYIFHKFKKYFLKKGFNVLRVYILGTPQNIPPIYEKLKVSENYKFDIKGYYCNENIDSITAPYFGSVEESHTALDQNDFDGLILAFDHHNHSYILDIIKLTEGKNIELFYAPDFLDIITSHFTVMEINGTPLFQFKAFTISGWQGLLKRTFDFIISIFSIIVLSPLFFILSSIIKMNSKGPIFYKQKRVSLDGKEFSMIKFRSMRTDAESESGPVWAKENDPRTTSIGKFLRRTSLDELPQLWNILIGDMSLVGPRPERLHFINQFKDNIPKYLERHRLRSGMTGWAQVNGLRGQSPIEQRTKFDLYYIENWSLWFDIKIIIMTFITIFKGENAY